MNNLPKLSARVWPYADQSDRTTKLLAFAELTIADSFVIRKIRILKKSEPGHDRPFVLFPAEVKKGDGKDRWFDIAHPLTAEARNAAVGLILEQFRQSAA